MEMLLPLLTVLITEGYKFTVKKIGKEATKIVIYVGVLILSGFWAWLQNPDIFSTGFFQNLSVYFAAAIGYYEVLIKWLVKENVIERFK